MPNNNRSLSEGQVLLLSLLPFKGQRWYHHLLLVAGGFVIWIGAYALIMDVMGWTALASLDSSEAIRVRRWAAAGAAATVATYFILALVRTYGGLGLSMLWYPMLIFWFMPDQVFSLFGPAPEYTVTTVSLTENFGGFFIDYAPIAFGHGGALFIVSIVVMTIEEKRSGDERTANFYRKWPDLALVYVATEEGVEKEGPKTQAVFRQAGWRPADDERELVDVDELNQGKRQETSGDQSLEDATLRELWSVALLFVGLAAVESVVYAILVVLTAGLLWAVAMWGEADDSETGTETPEK